MNEATDSGMARAPAPAEPRKPARKRAPADLRALARDHTRTAVRVLVGVMRSDEATPAARVSAANAILERGWGKAMLASEGAEASALKLFDRIERIIVHPGGEGRNS
jgi:hypothetical protein